MWRKIHSNRDPRDTLYSEISKEFNTYFAVAGQAGKKLFQAYPKWVFGLMVVSMLVSLVLSFTVFRPPPESKKSVNAKVNPVTDGFSQIMLVTGDIRETLRLKKLVDSLSAKKTLSPEDSTLLESALDGLSKLHQTIK